MIASASAHATSGTTNAATTATFTPTAGKVLVVAVVGFTDSDTTPTVTVTDTLDVGTWESHASLTHTFVAAYTYAGGAWVAPVVSAAAGTITVTITSAGPDDHGIAFRVFEVDGHAGVAQAAKATSGGPTVTVTLPSPPSTGSLIVGATYSLGATDPTVPAGWSSAGALSLAGGAHKAGFATVIGPTDAPATAKLIKHGQDIRTPAQIAANLTYVESLPFDGMTITLPSVSTAIFSSSAVSKATIDTALSPITSLSFSQLTDRFAICYAAPPNGTNNLTAGSAWTQTATNFGNLAAACQDAGLKGIFFDNEQYFGEVWGGAQNWTAAYARGEELMAAAIAEYPNIEVIVTYGPWVSDADSAAHFNTFGIEVNDVSWANWNMGPFVAGMIAATFGTAATVHDGSEVAYTARTAAQFDAIKAYNTTGVLASSTAGFIPSGDDTDYAAKVGVAFGIYNESYLGETMDASIWEDVITLALERATKYVWLYTEPEAENWWTSGGVDAEWIDATAAGRAAATPGPGASWTVADWAFDSFAWSAEIPVSTPAPTPPPPALVARLTDDRLLDLVDVGMRTDRFRVDVLNASNGKIGELHPPVGMKIDNDATRAIKRRASIDVSAAEFNDIDPLTHRLRPTMILENGSEYPLGVFMFADYPRVRSSYGLSASATLFDQGLILGQQLRSTVAVEVATNAAAAFAAIAAEAGVLAMKVDSTSASVGAPLVWPAGKSSATYGRVLSDLAAIAGFHDPYFDNDGVLVARRLTNPDDVVASLRYVDGGRIIAGSMLESNDLLSAPNLVIVVDTAAGGNPVTYRYELGADAPHAWARRGFWVPRMIEAPGVASIANAVELARTAIATDPLAWETVSFASPLDPRHDTFDIIDYRGQNYLEQRWSMSLTAGGEMTHEAKRVLL